MCYVPDYLDHWSEHNRQQEEEIEKLPICDCCGEHIQDEYCYVINGDYICESCMEENRRSVESLIG